MIAPHATVRPVIQAVAEHYGFTLDDVLTRSQSRSISRVRKIAVYVVRKTTSASYPEIGAVFGGRDHTTMMSSFSSVADMLVQDDGAALRLEVAAIIAKLTGVGPQPRDCSGLVYDGAGCTEVSCA